MTKTNFERIKEMNITEMAEWLANEIPHGDCYGCRLCGFGNSCRESWLEYLKTNISAFGNYIRYEDDEECDDEDDDQTRYE